MMSTSEARDSVLDARVLVQTPTGKDAALAQVFFDRAGIPSYFVSDPRRLLAELDAGAAALVIAEEFLLRDTQEGFARWLAAQPAWSDLPVVVLARPGVESLAAGRIMDVAGNVTVLERPTKAASLVSAVRAALRARQKQYQIREHLAERERTEAMLKASDRRKDEFLAILAHELRNPLAPIRNALHLLRLHRSDERTIEQVCEMMDRQVDHLVRLVDDLMEVSRISQGKIELRKEPVEIAVVVRSAVEASRPLLDGALQILKTTVPDVPLTLDGDPVRLAQVLANLLNNSAKYTAPGGQIWLDVEPEGAEVVLKVRDTGIGIPAEMLQRVFEPFTQVERSTGRNTGGLGIGLTLVKQLVEMHGGSVCARSDGPGKGSEFVVRLPLREAAPVDTHSKVEARTVSSLPRHRLLVVDDNHDAADSLGLLLKTLGAEVRTVYGGEDALGVLDAYRPSAILLDLGMPGMDGHEVAKLVRQRPEQRDTVLIALTGWGQQEDISRTRESGFDHHWIKPLDLTTLRKLLLSLDASRAMARG
jgi:two-component system, sensor histidine kinase